MFRLLELKVPFVVRIRLRELLSGKAMKRRSMFQPRKDPLKTCEDFLPVNGHTGTNSFKWEQKGDCKLLIKCVVDDITSTDLGVETGTS